MNRTRVLGVIGMGLLAGCATHPQAPGWRVVPGAVSPDASPTGGGDSFDCDTLAGHYSVWRHTISAVGGEVTGSAYFYVVRSDRRWRPWASVLLGSADRHSSAGLVFGQPSHQDSLVVNTTYGVTGHNHLTRVAPILPLGADVHFALRWGQGKLDVRIDPDPTWHPVPLSFSPARLSIGCSTADVVYQNVVITPPAPAAGS